jgi:CPA2 family monovalent cation:H+ antiporter-2
VPTFLAVGAPPLLADFAVVIVAAAIAGYLCQRAGVVPIIGYLLGGAVVGPFALGLIEDRELVEQMAELGVVFLMFSIGLELSGDELRRSGRLLFVGGALQVGLTVALVAGLCGLFGVGLNDGIFTGCLVALSSTAVVLKVLAAREETHTPTGRVAVSFLIFQDLAVVIMVLLVPMLGEGGGGAGDIVLEAAKALVIIVVVLAVTRRIVPSLLDTVAERTDGEEFLFAVLALSVGIAYLVTLLGLTASLGAFVAGLVVSSGAQRERALAYVMPFQVVFAAVFFASIGMLLDLGFVVDHVGDILFFALVVVVVKAVAVAAAGRALRQGLAVSAAAALLLAQIGEFSFVLNTVGADAGLSLAGRGDEGAQLFIAVAVILIAVTPLLKAAGERLARRLGGVPAAALEPEGGPAQA